MATDSENVQPELFAFLMCEKIVLDGEVAILWRIIDTFNYEVTLPGTAPQEVQENPNVSLRCQLFTRWGPPGEGDFDEQLGLITPNDEEVTRDEPRQFKMTGKGFQQTVWDIQLWLTTPGIYKWVLYLNGNEFARLPFTVNITRQATQTQTK